MKYLALIIPAAFAACQPLTPACNPLDRSEFAIIGQGPRMPSAASVQAISIDPIAPSPLLGGVGSQP
jgi:hypothetical protein